jgi:hypothetical protein
LAARFGSGVKLERAYVEITDDAITHGVEAKLPWLASSNVSPSLFAAVPSSGLRARSAVPPVEHLRYDDFRKLPN